MDYNTTMMKKIVRSLPTNGATRHWIITREKLPQWMLWENGSYGSSGIYGTYGKNGIYEKIYYSHKSHKSHKSHNSHNYDASGRRVSW